MSDATVDASMNVQFVWQFLPRRDERYDDPAYAEATGRAARAFRDAFEPRCSDVSVLYGPMGTRDPQVPWVNRLEVATTDATLVREAWEWSAANVWPSIPNAIFHFRCSASPHAVSHARWVPLPIVTSNPEAAPYGPGPDNRYPVACGRCRYLDLDRPPAPFQVWQPALAAKKKPGPEIFKALNAVLIVSRRVLDFFEQSIAGEFDSGPVANHEGHPIEGFHFVRPRAWVGEYVREVEQERCEACGRPRYYAVDQRGPWASAVHHFGPPGTNIARVGQYPHMRRGEYETRPAPTPEDVVVSGGLFAALYNMRVKGLSWPGKGPLLSFDGAPPLTPERRFADLFPGTLDRVQTRKRNERDHEIY